MTNSHSRTQPGARNADRYYSNASPQQGGFAHKRRSQKSPNTTFNSLTSSSSSLPLAISPNKLNGNRQNCNSTSSNQRFSPGGFSFSTSPNSLLSSSSSSSNFSTPPNLSYYAGSACFDAPAPTALPQPPRHWKMNCAQSAAHFGKNDDFSHNLKMVLNVKA